MKYLYIILLLLIIYSCLQKPKESRQESNTTKTISERVEKSIDKDFSDTEDIKSENLKKEDYQLYLAKRNPEYLDRIRNDLKIDSIADRPIKYYLDNPRIIPLSKKFYNGGLFPLDDSLTFNLLDSLTVNVSELSPFYKHLFDYLCIKADGALAEVMGSYSLTAVKHNTELYLSGEDFKQFNPICYELYFCDNLDKRLGLLEKQWKRNTSLNLNDRIDTLIMSIRQEVFEMKR